MIWAGFAAVALAALVYAVVGGLSAAPDWPNQGSYRAILGQVPRFTVAGLVAFWAGEFCNSFALARPKILTNGRRLWMRTIGSTVVGQAVDTGLFVLLGFGVTLPTNRWRRALPRRWRSVRRRCTPSNSRWRPARRGVGA